MMKSKNVDEIIKRLEAKFGGTDLVYLELLNGLTRIRRDSKNIVIELGAYSKTHERASFWMNIVLYNVFKI